MFAIFYFDFIGMWNSAFLASVSSSRSGSFNATYLYE